VWLDESVGSDAADVTGTPDHLAIEVEGQEYTAAENYDLDHDGTLDSARIEHEDGTVAVYSDTDHSGEADEYLHVDANGSVLESAHFDHASGQWVASEPPASAGTEVLASANAGMTSDFHGDPVAVGPATIDSDNDGHNDTAVVQDPNGTTELFTDTNGDGRADVDTVIDKTGASATYERGADGHWTQSTAAHDQQAANGQQGTPVVSDQAWEEGSTSERWV
jgi:hypothetical protein